MVVEQIKSVSVFIQDIYVIELKAFWNSTSLLGNKEVKQCTKKTNCEVNKINSLTYRISHLYVFCGKAGLKYSADFIGKHLR